MQTQQTKTPTTGGFRKVRIPARSAARHFEVLDRRFDDEPFEMLEWIKRGALI
jgi:hypothetical protein